MNPKDFYELAKHPTAELLDDYPWLKKVLPRGLARGLPVAGDVPRPAGHDGRGADPRHARRLPRQIGDRLDVPADRGSSFYEVLTLASMVEREAVVDDDRPQIAGVFENRLTRSSWPTGLPRIRPVFYGPRHAQARSGDVRVDRATASGHRAEATSSPAELPDDLAGYNTYTSGLPRADLHADDRSIDAALEPDTKDQLPVLPGQDGRLERQRLREDAQEHQANNRRSTATT
jgi:hypothetical protein